MEKELQLVMRNTSCSVNEVASDVPLDPALEPELCVHFNYTAPLKRYCFTKGW